MPIPTCPACGKSWGDHLGLADCCAELQRVVAQRDALKEAAKAALVYMDGGFAAAIARGQVQEAIRESVRGSDG